MKKLIAIAIVLVTVFALTIPALAENEGFGIDMWVNCANGKTLNVREAPSTNSRTITRLPCGTKVHVDYSCGNGWVAISDRDDDFVSVANPYMVTAKALNAKTDRSVGLRVKPNKTSNALRRLNAGDRLQVIARGKTWSKVVDMLTGKTGYVANDYIQKI